MQQDHERFMRIALEEAARGGAEGNRAVGSVIVRDGAVLARGRNLAHTNHDPTAHAETVALRAAGVALGHTDLSGYNLYTTIEPCIMCCGAIMVSGISVLVMGGRNAPSEGRYGDYRVERLLEMAKWGEKLAVVAGVLPQECLAMRDDWLAKNKGPYR